MERNLSWSGSVHTGTREPRLGTEDMDVLINDLKLGLRLLWKNKGFTATAIATLAVCIGVNTAIFSVVHSVVLKPLPFPESDRVLLMYNSYPGAGVEYAAAGVPDYYDRLKGAPAFEEQALYNTPALTIGSAGSVQQVSGMSVTPSFFRLLRAKPRRRAESSPKKKGRSATSARPS